MPANVKNYIGREAAWHGLGTVTGKFNTWAEILAHGGLDFEVVKKALEFGGVKLPTWGTFRIDGQKQDHTSVLVTSGSTGVSKYLTFLGNVGEDYKVIPHSTGFEIVDQLVNSTDGAHYESAGVLGSGEVVWGLADLALSTRVGDDEHKHYLLFHTSHDGSYSYEFRDADVRVVCQNTLNMALSEKTKNKFRIRHTKNALDRVVEAKEALSAYRGDVQTFAGKMQLLAGRRVVRESLDKILLAGILCSVQRTADSLRCVWRTDLDSTFDCSSHDVCIKRLDWLHTPMAKT